MHQRILILGLTFLLSACGGGTSGVGPQVSSVYAKSLKYSQTATIYIIGKYLRTDVVAKTGSCASPTYGADSTTDTLVLHCKVTKTGALPITIQEAGGAVLLTDTLTVPQPQATFITSGGTVVVELYPDKVPATVDNFLGYVNNGYYFKTLFHRVISGFVVQAGGYTAGPVVKEGQLAPIALETNRGLSNARGTLAMARKSDPNSATSEFFINVVDNTFLDYSSPESPGYAVFGKVVSDMAIVDAIAAKPTGSAGGLLDVPLTDVTIALAVQTR